MIDARKSAREALLEPMLSAAESAEEIGQDMEVFGDETLPRRRTTKDRQQVS